jgi:hypothetical protein
MDAIYYTFRLFLDEGKVHDKNILGGNRCTISGKREAVAEVDVKKVVHRFVHFHGAVITCFSVIKSV